MTLELFEKLVNMWYSSLDFDKVITGECEHCNEETSLEYTENYDGDFIEDLKNEFPDYNFILAGNQIIVTKL